MNDCPGYGSMGQWMYADFQYEHFNEKFLFQENNFIEVAKDLEGCTKCSLRSDGSRESWRNPLSARAWGKAAVDVGMLGFSAAKATGVLGRAGRVGKIADELGIIGKSGSIVKGKLPISGLIFFENARYSPKVLRQMGKGNDIYHAFPKIVDRFASKYGKLSNKTGLDGKRYQWLEMHGSYKNKIGTFEFIKDENNVINHRYFKITEYE